MLKTNSKNKIKTCILVGSHIYTLKTMMITQITWRRLNWEYGQALYLSPKTLWETTKMPTISKYSSECFRIKKKLGINISIKLHYLHRHLGIFNGDWSNFCEKQMEQFHQNFEVMLQRRSRPSWIVWRAVPSKTTKYIRK